MPVTFSEQSTTTFPQPAAGGRMTFIDADGDGDLDILYQTGANGTAFQYARSNGDGTYTILALGSSPFAGLTIPDHNGGNFHVGDIDGDGDMDLWAGQASGAGTGSYFRNDNGTFTSQSSATFPQPGASSRVVMADFDGDGDADMLYQTVGNGTAFQYAQSNGNGTYTLLAQGSSPFAGLTLLDNGGGTHYAADFDGDGDIDLWAASASTTGAYYVNNGNGTFSVGDSSTFPAPAAATRVVMGDFDSDGDADILYQTAGNGTAFQYARANGDGTMTILSQASSPFAGVTLIDHNGSNFIAGDIDGDGDHDVLGVANGTTGEHYMANGKPPEISSTTPSDNGTGVAVGANIVLTFDESVSKGSGNIYIYRGDGVLIETISVGSAQVSGSGTTWTIDPSVTLAGLTNYYILTDDGIFADADGSIFAGISDPITLNFTTAVANTAPTFTNLNGDTAGYGEGNVVRLDVGQNATVADTTSANFDTGTLTVTITAGGTAAQDVLSIANIGAGAGQISVSGSAVSYSGVQIGTFTGGTGGAALVVTLDPDATPAATQALVRALQYSNTSENPSTATRTVTIVLTDGDGGTSATQTTSVGVTSINDAPVNAVPGTQSINEDTSVTLSTANGNAISVADVDATMLTVTLSVAHGELTLASTAGLSFSVGDGTADTTMTFTGAAAAINAALGAGLSYVPGADFNGSDAISVVTNDGGQTGNDPGLTGTGTTEEDTDTVTINVAAANDVHTGGASITGSATEDQVLTAVSTIADADGLGTLHYQWQRDTGSGYVNVGTDQATYTLSDADIGGVVRVVIYYTDAGGTVESATSAASAAITAANDAPTGGVSITGTTTEDQVLTADTSTLADTDGLGTLHYDWQRDTGSGFVSTGAADQATYTLGDADVGAVVRVVVSYTDAQGFSESATSAASFPISSLNDIPTGGVFVTGAMIEGQILVADSSSLSDADGLGSFRYQWQRDGGFGFEDVGVDQDTYALDEVDVGALFRVIVTYVDGQYYSETVLSPDTVPVTGVDDPSVAGDDAVDVDETQVASGSLFANDSDADGPALTVSAVNGSTSDVGTEITLPSGALLTVNANGVYSYDPNGAFNSLPGAGSGAAVTTATDTFTYTLANGNTATVTVTIHGEDSPGDIVEGDSDDNALVGGDGGDTLSGGPGVDSLDGGDGEDWADYGPASSGVVVGLNGGLASNDGDGGLDTLVNIENVVGSAFNDVLVGAAGDNVMHGGAGRDVLIGLDGNDTLVGGAGAANQLQGGQGDDDYWVEANDTVVEFLNQGHDRIFTSRNTMTLVANVEELHFTGAGSFTGTGNALANTIASGSGDDLLSGRGGDDVLRGGAGTDTATYAAAAAGVSASLLTGAVGNDGDGGSDTLIDIENLIGSAFGDNLVGSDGANTISGGLGNDIIRGNGGNDLLQGGAGTDYVSYSSATSVVVVRLDLQSAQDGTGGTDTIVSFENVLGSQYADIIVGDAAGNLLQGEGGADILIGRGGNDTLFGGAGAANTLFGGAGDDWYRVEANDTIVELAGEGYDTVLTARNQFTLAANVEVLNFNGTGNFAGTGNAADNTISGGDGLDTLIGGGGDDALNGGLGNDTARYSGTGAQYLIEDLGGGRYRVTDTVGGRDGVDILNDIERVSFSDGARLLAGLGAPVPSAKMSAQVLPTLSDDAFVQSKDLDLPLVLPGDAALGASATARFAFSATGADMLAIDDAGVSVAPPEDHRGTHHHDDWMC